MPNCDNTNFFIQSIVSRLIKIESKLITRYCASNYFMRSDPASGFWGQTFSGASSITRNFSWNVNFCLELLTCWVSWWWYDELCWQRFEATYDYSFQFTLAALVDCFWVRSHFLCRVMWSSPDFVSSFQAAHCLASPSWYFSSRGAWLRT